MKAIQITVDRELLEQIDATPEAQREGRSEVFRRAAEEYLRRRRREAIAAGYAAAYGREGLGEEFEGWERQGQWPPD